MRPDWVIRMQAEELFPNFWKAAGIPSEYYARVRTAFYEETMPWMRYGLNGDGLMAWIKCVPGSQTLSVTKEQEYVRRCDHEASIKLISKAIVSLHQDRFITPAHTAEFIESLITMTDAKRILELGMYSGFTTLHMIRAIIGKPSAKVTAVDHRPAHDNEFFAREEIAPWFEFVRGLSPDCLPMIPGAPFDLVFVDSQHSLEHTAAELQAILGITHPNSLILFHDCPVVPDTVHNWLLSKVHDGTLRGAIFPTASQQDVERVMGPGHPESNPHLGVFMRN